MLEVTWARIAYLGYQIQLLDGIDPGYHEVD